MGRYVPQLDGLRTAAILLVIGVHTRLIPAGYLGVDLFFVLSGFLITRILLRERESGRWNVRAFYGRRFRRLYPALVTMLLLTLPFDRLVVGGSTRHQLLAVAVSGAYLANFADLYPHTVSWLGGLVHTWSLALEEQFYLLWPLTLPLVIRRRHGTLLLCGMALGMLVLLAIGPDPFRRLLIGRGGVLLVGCALALLTHRRPVPKPGLLAAIGATFVGLIVLLGRHAVGTNSQQPLSALVALPAAMLIGGIVEGGTLARLLAWRPVVWMGQRSYGIYLWHFPILWIIVMSGHTPASRAVLAAVVTTSATALAAASYRLVETRFRSRGPRPTGAPSQAAAGTI